MAWMKVETAVARNRKFVKAGPAASWLWVCGLAFCQEGLTDGLIPAESLPFLGVKNARPLADALVKAGLWDEQAGGWHVHDYLGHNKSAQHVRAEQDHKRRAGERGGYASGAARRHTKEPPDETEGEARGEADTSTPAKHPSKQTGNPDQIDQIRSDRSDQREQSASLPAPVHRTTPIQSPRRKDAAWEGPRVYVPQRAHRDFLAIRGGDDVALSELLGFYESVSEAWTVGARRSEEPGADMFAFWKARYSEKWPTAPALKQGGHGPEWLQRARAAKAAGRS